MVMPVNVAPNPQSERAQTTETPCSEPKTRFGEYPGFILLDDPRLYVIHLLIVPACDAVMMARHDCSIWQFDQHINPPYSSKAEGIGCVRLKVL